MWCAGNDDRSMSSAAPRRAPEPCNSFILFLTLPSARFWCAGSMTSCWMNSAALKRGPRCCTSTAYSPSPAYHFCTHVFSFFSTKFWCAGNMTSCSMSSAAPNRAPRLCTLTAHIPSPLQYSSELCMRSTGLPIGACQSTMASDSSTLSL